MLSALVSMARYNEPARSRKYKDEYTPISLYRSSDEKRMPSGNKLHSINGAILLSQWSISYCVERSRDKQPLSKAMYVCSWTGDSLVVAKMEQFFRFS